MFLGKSGVEVLQVKIETITHHRDDFFIAKGVRVDGNGNEVVTVKGSLVDPVFEGNRVEVTGNWQNDKRWGWQFAFTQLRLMPPTDAHGLREFLGSGLFPGIGSVTAGRIVDTFGMDTKEIIEKDQGRLSEVKGISASKAQQIHDMWMEQYANIEVMALLQGYGITAKTAAKIYKHFGDNTSHILQYEPYKLTEVDGIGFKKADDIALAMGMKFNSPDRVMASFEYIINTMSKEGHVFVTFEQLVAAAEGIIGINDAFFIRNCLEISIADGRVFRDTGFSETGVYEFLYSRRYYHAETGSTRAVINLASHPISIATTSRVRTDRTNGDPEGCEEETHVASVDAKNLLNFPGFYDKDGAVMVVDPHEIMEEHNQGMVYPLSPQQTAGAISVVQNKCTIITGGAGTGKTTTMQGVIHLASQYGARILLCSPTGKAAKRLSEATGRGASTVHRLLEYNPSGGFQRNFENPLECDLIIVDEASMLDISLFYALVRALPVRAHLLLVGDIHQLESVGPGSVLKDLIDSGVFNVVRLEQIFRQGKDSYIIVNSNLINNGYMPKLNDGAEDFYFIEIPEDEDGNNYALDATLKAIRHIAQAQHGYDPIQDVQIIAPQYAGAAGIRNLNRVVQEELNPSRSVIYSNTDHEYVRGKGEHATIYRVGDKVMQLKNNYQKAIFNGDTGIIRVINIRAKKFVVEFDDGRHVEIEFGELDQLTHAYAISIHKSQGSEYPVCIIPLTNTSYHMMKRTLFYTAVTRGKRLVVLIGTRKIVRRGVENNVVQFRNSYLSQRIAHMAQYNMIQSSVQGQVENTQPLGHTTEFDFVGSEDD